MSKGYTKDARQQAKQLRLDHSSPQLVIDANNRRLYLTQRLEFGGEVKIDATGLYCFLKEMFTTNWQDEAKQ